MRGAAWKEPPGNRHRAELHPCRRPRPLRQNPPERADPQAYFSNFRARGWRRLPFHM